MSRLDGFVADAILGIDTLWGGDVMCPSGTGRFIADSWFSDQPLPRAYTHATASSDAAATPLALSRITGTRENQLASSQLQSCSKSLTNAGRAP